MKARFEKLDALLKQYEELWRPSAFTNLDNTRLEQYPGLLKWLSSLSDEKIDQLQISDGKLLNSCRDHFKDAEALRLLTTFSSSQQDQHLVSPSPFWNKDIPGRKAEQIQKFSSALYPFSLPVTEWCCGKLHLGRLVSEISQQSVTGLEINPSLVQQANSLAKKRKLNSPFKAIECDVMDKDAEEFISENTHLLALHACGGLHVRMLEKGVSKLSSRISFSPCCYHRFTNSVDYHPLSRQGKSSQLKLSNEDLRLATRQCNIASAAETRKRKQLQAWRLGFDLLQREVRQTDEYLPCPSFSPKILKKGFEDFCHNLANIKGLELPGSLDFKHFEAKGQQNFIKYQRLELVRMLFRRALEVWLVLDRILFLEEHAYHCEIFEFCESSVSPRNLLIDSYRVNH